VTAVDASAKPGRRRMWILAGGFLAAAVVAAGAVIIATQPDTPEDVIGDYLDLLLQRDVEGALGYVDPKGPLDWFPQDMLVSEAIADDWTVAHIVRRYAERDDPAVVDVTIKAADGAERQGRFELDPTEDGGWRIRNPLVLVSTVSIAADTVEFNGARTTAEEFWVFPGVYRSFPGLKNAVTAPDYLAVPEPDGDAVAKDTYAPLFSAGQDQEAVLGRDLAAWLDGCAVSTELNPEGCPFAAGYEMSSGKAEWVSLDDGTDYLADKVTWAVESYPKARLVPTSAAKFVLTTVAPGVMRISGEAPPFSPEGAPSEKFSGNCRILLDRIEVMLTPDGFAFRSSEVEGTC